MVARNFIVIAMSSRDYVGKSKNKRNDDGKNVASTVDDFLSSDPTESPTDEERRQLSARKESSIEDDLARFRDNWKQEIENKTDQVKEKTNKKSKNKKIVRKSQDSSQNQSDEVDSSSSGEQAIFSSFYSHESEFFLK